MDPQQICPTCGAPRRAGARFCVSCGATLPAQAPTGADSVPQHSPSTAARTTRRKDRRANKVVVRAGRGMVFPPRCVCCTREDVQRRHLKVLVELETMPQFTGTSYRSWKAKDDVSIPGVPYCPTHQADLDAHITLGKAGAQVTAGMPGWEVIAVLGVVLLLVLASLGASLFGPLGALAGFLLVFVGGVGGLVLYIDRRTKSLAGGVSVPSSALPRDQRPKYYGGVDGAGTLGFQVGVAGRFETGPAPTFVRESISLEFQDGAYAALFRAENQSVAAGSQAQTGLKAT